MAKRGWLAGEVQGGATRTVGGWRERPSPTTIGRLKPLFHHDYPFDPAPWAADRPGPGDAALFRCDDFQAGHFDHAGFFNRP